MLTALAQAFGGTLLLLVLIPVSIAIARLRHSGFLLTAYLNVSITCFLGLNYLNFRAGRSWNGAQDTVIIYNTVIAMVLVGLAFVTSRLLIDPRNLPNSERLTVLKENFLGIRFSHSVFAFICGLSISIVFYAASEEPNNFPVRLPVIPTCLLPVPGILVAMHVAIRIWGTDKLNYIVKKRDGTGERFREAKSAYIIASTLILTGGTIIEIFSRGNMLLWVETAASLGLLLLFIETVTAGKYILVDYEKTPQEQIIYKPARIVKEIAAYSLACALLTGVIVAILALDVSKLTGVAGP